MEELITRTEDRIDELPDRIEGEWGDDGFVVEIVIVEEDDEVLIVIEDPLPPIEEWPEDPEDDTHTPNIDQPDMTMPDWLIPDEDGDIWWDDDDDWGGGGDVDDGIWLDIPDITLPEWNTDDDDDWPDDAPDLNDNPDETNGTDTDDSDDQDQDDDDQPDTDTQVGEGPEPPEPPDEVDSDDDLLGGEPGDDTPDPPVIEDPPPPPPQPSWSGGSDQAWETLPNETSTATDTTTTTNVTSELGFNSSDGYWYQTVTTATTVTETETVSTISGTRLRTYSWSCYDDGMGGGGCDDATSYSNTQSTTTVADPTVVDTTTTSVITTIPASCSQGGWTGFGDWCIVGGCSVCNSSTPQTPANRNQRDIIQFTVPDDPDVVGETRRIVIEAETNLRRDQFGQNNQHADPYVYLYNDTDADVGDHSGDTDEYTRGSLIEQDDDGGRDCSVGGDSWSCANPPADAEDEAEFPNDTIVGYSTPRPVIQNVQNQWDSEIDRLMQPGDYAVEATVYNAANAGWYRLTISDETVESDGS